MRLMIRPLLFPCLLLLLAFGGVAYSAEDAPGKWTKPPADGRPWKHAGTGLEFPQLLGTYRLTGDYAYEGGKGGFVRYDSEDERARADIFLIKPDSLPSDPADRKQLQLKELETVVKNLEDMVREGLYKNVIQGDIIETEIPLWHKDPLPIVVRNINATRMARTKEGIIDGVLDQWIGVTLYEGYLITIRHVRPSDTGEAGEESVKKFVSSVFQIIKDPSLRADIKVMLDIYLESPLSEDGLNASKVVMTYLQQMPYFPITVPTQPTTEWLMFAKQAAPGSEAQLLASFMLGAAKVAFAGADAEACLNAGSKQFAVVYKQLRQHYPMLARPDIDKFVGIAEKNQGAQYFRDKMTGK